MTPEKSSGYTYLLPGRLAQGSAPPPDLPPGSIPFDVIVLAADEYQPDLSGHEVLRAPLDDSGPPPTLAERQLIRMTARDVANRLRRGQRVLVTCMQGRNRSGVIAGLALVDLGYSGREVAQKIQELRNGLTNPYFFEMVVGS